MSCAGYSPLQSLLLVEELYLQLLLARDVIALHQHCWRIVNRILQLTCTGCVKESSVNQSVWKLMHFQCTKAFALALKSKPGCWMWRPLCSHLAGLHANQQNQAMQAQHRLACTDDHGHVTIAGPAHIVLDSMQNMTPGLHVCRSTATHTDMQ